MACRDLAAADGLRQRAALQHVAREEPHRQGIPGAIGIHHGVVHENGRKVVNAIPRAQGAALGAHARHHDPSRSPAEEAMDERFRIRVVRRGEEEDVCGLDEVLAVGIRGIHHVLEVAGHRQPEALGQRQ